MEDRNKSISEINTNTTADEDQFITDKLFASIVLKKFKLARILAEGGADVKSTLSSGVTPLMAACDAVTEKRHLGKKCEVIFCLLKNGADINAKDKYDRTPLHYACINGCTEVIKILEENGADKDQFDLNGKNPSFYTENEFTEKRFSIRTKRDSIATESMMNTNFAYRHWDSREFLNSPLTMDLKRDGLLEMNGNSSSFEEDQLITDKLFAAIVSKKFKLARILAEGGVDVKATLPSGVTPLMAACDAVIDDRHLEKKCGVISCLIRNGADVNAKDNDDRTPLHYACINGCNDIIEILRENGADLFAVDINGKVPKFYSDKNFMQHQFNVRTRRDSIAVLNKSRICDHY